MVQKLRLRISMMVDTIAMRCRIMLVLLPDFIHSNTQISDLPQ